MITQQLLLPLLPETLKSFELFVPGKNQLVLETLKNPLQSQFIYLFGSEGTGKTHLLEAYAAQALTQKKRLLFLPLKNLKNHTDYLKDWPEFNAVLIDDIEYLAPNLEIELFYRFNELQAKGTSLIITSALPPQALSIELADLKSRLNSGLALKIEALRNDELKMALTLHAKHLGLKLADETYDFLLNHLNRDLAQLTQQLKIIAEYSLRHKRRVTLALIKAVLNL
jgi:DnaA family protein